MDRSFSLALDTGDF